MPNSFSPDKYYPVQQSRRFHQFRLASLLIVTSLLGALPARAQTGAGTRVINITPPPNGTYVAGQTLTFTAMFNGPVTVVNSSNNEDRPFLTWTAWQATGTRPGNIYGVPTDFPAGHFPPPGSSRIWYPERPDGQQPPPGRTDEISRSVPLGTWLISKGNNPDDIRLAVYHATQPGVVVAVFWYGQSGRMIRQELPIGAVAGGSYGPTRRVPYVSGSGTSVLTFSYLVQVTDSAPSGVIMGTAVQLPAGVTLRDTSGATLNGVALTLPWATNPITGLRLNGAAGGNAALVVLKPGEGLLAGQTFTLPATTASGQPITWMLVSGNGSLNGNSLTPRSPGAVVVRATLTGTPAPSVPLAEFGIDAEDPRDASNRGKSAHRERLSNLSSRLRVFSNDANRAAIAGFVVTGTAPKQVLIRAVGPGLTAFGVTDAVSGARLQLHNGTGVVIAQNDGWTSDAAMTSAADRVGAFRLANGSRDSALLVTLPPGAYTAQVGAAGNGTALLEVYDTTESAILSTEQLINISTRGFVDTGEGNLIAGFVVAGDAPKRVLVRGIGPALAGLGVTGALEDPLLELYTASGSRVIARNDNWEATQAIAGGAAIADSSAVSVAAAGAGAFALGRGSKDAAILVTLMPGNYSVVVRGVNNTTGVGLVEVYEVANR